MEINKNNKDKFLKGFLSGALTTAFAGLIVVGIATGIHLIAGRVTDTQTKTRIGEQTDLSQEADSPLDLDRIITKLGLIQRIISSYYLFEEDPELMEAGAYAGFMSGLQDPYSVYYTKDDYKKLMENTGGIYCGIGASVTQDRNTGLTAVVKVFKESPAAEAGMLPGDIICKVYGIETTGMDLDLLVNHYIRGEENTEVEVTVFRAELNEYVELLITRRRIEVETVEYQMLDGNMGYVLISQFDVVTTGQFKTAVEELEAAGMESLIVDLRNNPGGLLESVVEMIAYVLPEDRMDGLLLYTEDRDGEGDKFYSKYGQIRCEPGYSALLQGYPKEDGHQIDVPMAVLINGNSASASEIFAGALKDYDWATLVGTTTYGKGIVQNLISLGDGTAVKLTTSHYFTPSGYSIHEKGVKPDVEIELAEGLQTRVIIEVEEDNQLQKAIEVLREKQ